jgi:sensor c-di-GMP phosphodiesterase-like protein
MEEFSQGSSFGTLIVFTVIAATILLVMIANMRTRLRSVPETAEILAQQFAFAHNEATSSETAIAQNEKAIADLERQLSEQMATVEERRQRLSDARNRIPSLVYVLDQIIQLSHQPWLVPVRLEGAAATDGDWINGRRYLVYGEDIENARRRIEVRYPAREGYRAAEPQPFKVA